LVFVLVFGVALLVAVLVSGIAARTILSTSLLFLVGGALVGQGGLGLVDAGPHGSLVGVSADLALFTVLFTDGQRAGVPELRGAWRLSGRALLVGMPLTLLGIALLVRVFTGLDWITSLLVGAILSPTDPVFAAAIVGEERVPARLRQLLNVESGLNDGLALPVVVVLLSLAQHGRAELATVVLELVAGIALGVLLPVVAAGLTRLPLLGPTPQLQPLGPVAVGVIIYAVCHLTGANPYLAAFAAGSTIATVAPAAQRAFAEFGELLAELAKFFALLLFGALLTPELLGGLSLGGYAAAVLAILLVRPVALLVSLLRTPLPMRERLAAAWFGPKGFSSVVYGLLVLHSAAPSAETVFRLVAVTIAISIVAHSSTDVLVARLFGVEDVACLPEREARAA
jgi:sodium/hydrogen antiporter